MSYTFSALATKQHKIQNTSKSYLIFWKLVIDESLPIKSFRIFLQVTSIQRILTVSIFLEHPVYPFKKFLDLFDVMFAYVFQKNDTSNVNLPKFLHDLGKLMKYFKV